MQKRPQFAILLFLISFGAVGAMLLLPALPQIQEYFAISVAKTQSVISAYLFGYALGQLPYGPLANRFGRKSALYIGLLLSFSGVLLCLFSYWALSFPLLVFSRFIQGMGASAGLKMSYTIIAESYVQKESAKKISYLTIAFAIMPGLAVFIGGFLTTLLGWQSCFYFLAFYALAVLYGSTRLPQMERPLDLSALQLSSLFRNYRKEFKNRRILLCGLIMGLGSSVIYVFSSKAPFIGIEQLGLHPDTYGLFNLIPLSGMVVSAYLGGVLAGKFPPLSLLFYAVLTSLVFTGVTFLLFLGGWVSAWSLFLPMFFIYLPKSIILSNVTSYALMEAENKPNASAVMNFLNLSVGFLAVVLVEWISPTAILSLPLSFFFFFLLMLIAWKCFRDR